MSLKAEQCLAFFIDIEVNCKCKSGHMKPWKMLHIHQADVP